MSKNNKLSFLKKIDVFGQPIQLYFEGDTKHKTRFGGLVTLIIIGILLALLIQAFMQLSNRNEVNITTQTDYAFDPPKIALAKNDFRFAILPQNIKLNYSIFSYTASISSPTNSTSILLRPCLQSDFSDFEDEYIKFGLNQSICSAIDEIDIQGGFGDNYFTYVKLAVVKCVNGTTPGVICAPQSDIDNYFLSSPKVRVSLYFTNQLINPFDYENPYQLYLENLAFLVSSLGKLVRSTDLYLRETTVNSANNVAGTGDGINMTKSIYSNERIDDMYVPLANDINYLNLYIRSSNNVVTYYRKYNTLGNVLSYIGGIWNLLYMVLGFVAAYFNNIIYQEKIANLLYDFDSKDINENKIKRNKKSNAMKKQQQEFISTKPKISIAEKKFIKMKEIRADLKLSCKDITLGIFSCFVPKNHLKKHELLNKATEQLSKDIDLRVILKRIQETDKLKNIVLNEDEQIVFHFVPPPIIRPDELNKLNDNEKELNTDDKINKSNVDDNNKQQLYKQLKTNETPASSVRNEIMKGKSSSEIDKIREEKQAQKELKDLCQVFPFYEDHFDKYKRVKNNSTRISKGLLESLHPEITDIFEALCESEALEQSSNKENNQVKYDIHSNKNQFFESGKDIISKINNDVQESQISLEINDIPKQKQHHDNEKDVFIEIIAIPKIHDDIDLGPEREITLELPPI